MTYTKAVNSGGHVLLAGGEVYAAGNGNIQHQVKFVGYFMSFGRDFTLNRFV